MTARLRELAERWNAANRTETLYVMGKTVGMHDCARELLAILDAEGDGCAVTELIRTAPEQIYLQISDDESDHEEAFPADHGDEITWCADSVLDCEVKYIRSDLVTRHDCARSGEVSDADVEQAFQHACAVIGGYRTKLCRKSMRAALEHFAKGERHE